MDVHTRESYGELEARNVLATKELREAREQPDGAIAAVGLRELLPVGAFLSDADLNTDLLNVLKCVRRLPVRFA